MVGAEQADWRLDTDPKAGLADRGILRVLHVLRYVQIMPSTPIFRSVVEAESQLATGMSIASDELAHVRATLSVEAAMKRQNALDEQAQAEKEKRERRA